MRTNGFIACAILVLSNSIEPAISEDKNHAGSVTSDTVRLETSPASDDDKSSVKPKTGHSSGTAPLPEVQATLDFRQGYQKIVINNIEDVILVLGNTGAGKTTFTQWMTGDGSKLQAVETRPNSGEIIIKDTDNKIGNNTIISQTIFPEFVVDHETKTTFCDLPGFSDTRSVSNEIASSYFIKKVISHCDRIKMVFIVSHPSLRTSVDRLDFMKLLKHATDLVKDIDKFQDSIALVATKVDNQLIKSRAGNGYTLIGDDTVIQNIGDFLQEVRLGLIDKIGSDNIDDKQRTFLNSSMKLIDVFSIKDNGHYRNIGLFRRPLSAGSLDDSVIVDEKKHIQEMIKRLVFNKKRDTDFGHTISEKSENKVSNLVEEINKIILFDVSTIANEVRDVYRSLIYQAETQIASINIHDTTEANLILSDVSKVSLKLSKGVSGLNKLVMNINIISTPKELKSVVSECITELDVDIPRDTISDIWQQGDYLEFLQTVSTRKVNSDTNSPAWAFYFESVVNGLMGPCERIQKDIAETTNKIEMKIKSDIKTTCSQIMKHFTNKEINILDPKSLYEDFKASYIKISRIQTTVDKLNPNEYIQRILGCFPFINIRFSENIVSNIVSNDIYLYNLRNEIEDIVKYLDNSSKWYKFLSLLYERLLEYDVQKDTRQFYHSYSDIHFLNNGVTAQDCGLENFLNVCCPEERRRNKLGFDTVTNVILDSAKLNALNNILTSTLKHETEFNCDEPGKLVIRGQYVKLSDRRTRKCEGEVSSIEIFALNRIFIDEDLNFLGKNMILSIISPIWDIQGDRKFVLDGLPGESHTPAKAKDGSKPRAGGESGKSGQTGSPGGNFFGIGKTFINGHRLAVSANGGDGGAGQHGGQGVRGVDGTSPSHVNGNPNNYKYNWKKEGCTINRFLLQRSIYWVRYQWYVFGKNCSDGGYGGNGGYGGTGGSPGFINVISLYDSVTIKLSKQRGMDGEHGKWERGGAPGKRGQLLKFEEIISISASTGSSMFYEYSDVSRQDLRQCDYGESGSLESKAKDLSTLQQSPSVKYYTVVNRYKSYSREHLIYQINASDLKRFLFELDDNDAVEVLYDIPGYFEDLINLETQFNSLHRNLQLLPFYESFLKRINKYIEKLNRNDWNEYRNTLNYLSLATISSMYYMRNNIDNFLVIDINKYLSIVKKHIQNYEESLHNIIIDSNRNLYYKDSVTSRITSANIVIEKVILPEIDKILEVVDDQIKLSIDDVLKEREKAKHQKEILIEKKKKLESQLSTKAFLGCIKFVGQCLNILGPGGAVAAGVISTGTDVIENALFDDVSVTAVKSAKESISQVIDYFQREQVAIKNNLENVIRDINQKNNSELQTVLDKVKNLQEVLKKDNLERHTYFVTKLKTKNELQLYRSDLIKEIDSEEKGLNLFTAKDKESMNFTENEKNQTKKISAEFKIKVLSRIQNAITIGEAGYDMAVKLSNDRSKVSAVDESIQEVNDQITKFKQYEQVLYDVLIPMRTNFETSLKEVGQRSSNQSHSHLEVSKWQIQNIVTDFEMNVQYIVHVTDPIIQLQLNACIRKLLGGMQSVLQIYDHIQDYKDHAKFANYIADMSSKSTNVNIKEFKEYVHRLELIRGANLILQEFEKVSSTFTQHVYPFAKLYLSDLGLSSRLSSDKSIDIVNNALEKINKLGDELTIEASVIKNKNFFIFPNVRFDIENVNQRPFYIWKHDTDKDEISNLLLGNEVMLKADIKNGIQKNAIKFKDIGIRFVATNASVQNDLDKDLNNFLVRMVHLGNSYYKCDDVYHVITHNMVGIMHSVNKGHDGHYYHMDLNSGHFQKNLALLSPYTTWKVQLSSKDSNYNFNVLKKYSRETIDLALEGRGHYIELGVDMCNDDLRKYYKEAPYFEIDG